MLSSAVPARLGRVRLQRPPSTRPCPKPASHPNWNSRYKALAGKVFFPVVHSVKKIIALKFHHDAMLSNSSGSSSKPKRKNSWWRLRWMRGWQTHPKTATLRGKAMAAMVLVVQDTPTWLSAIQCMMFKSLVQKKKTWGFVEVPIVQSDHYLNCELEDSLLQKLLSRTEMKTFLGSCSWRWCWLMLPPNS